MAPSGRLEAHKLSISNKNTSEMTFEVGIILLFNITTSGFRLLFFTDLMLPKAAIIF